MEEMTNQLKELLDETQQGWVMYERLMAERDYLL